MAITLAKASAAFKAADVNDEQAEAAAEQLAAYEDGFANIENRCGGAEVWLVQVENPLDRIDNRLGIVDGKVVALTDRMTVLTWAVGINAAATIAILGILLQGHEP